MSTLLRDVLDIPEHAGAEDFVLRLTDSVDDAAVARTLDEYVVTPALADAFDRAMALVAEAITSGYSRGAFLTGSFGAGKSHFMAVLHALLRHHAAARAKAQLQPVIAAHDDVLLDRKVLPLAFHFLGAETMEQALFDGYLKQVQRLHPEALLPAVHESDRILQDGEHLRKQLGDERFFASISGEGEPADHWAGVLGAGSWTAERYEASRASAPGAAARQELVTRLVEKHFSAFTQQATYVDLDTGLIAIAEHAKSLGYDAIVLLLDELVLWLSFSVRDQAFFGREAQKLTKLVESASGPRPIPIVSFVARQMDLRRWFADAGASGAQQEALDTAFRHQEGRFSTLPLGDDNLPYVANRRLLRPRDEAAERELTAAFSHLDRRPEVWDVLLDGINTDQSHRGADEAAFRLTYPFSPALVSTLRSLAGAMQRERTALKVMQQMLVERRDTLTVDDLIPVGDSFDLLVEGRDALDNQAAALFKSASALYRDKLRPLLLQTHGLSANSDVGDGSVLPPAFRADDRLAKTLLLSAVAPNVPALKELTAGRLASLNHGSIVAPLAGAEAAIVLTKVREWSRKVPEIHVDSDTRNPVIRVQLSDVDYESVVDRARAEDNEGRRRELLKDIVREALGVITREADIFGAHRHPIVWRGSRREVDIVFGNVRDAGWLTEEHFRARPGTWRFVIDHPFDEPGHSTNEDLVRVDRLKESLATQTVVWLPHFFSEERLREVRRLVILDWLLGGTGEHWTNYADHLSEVDRAQARAILESQRTALREGLRRAVQQAYGAAAPTPGVLADDSGHDQVLTSLDAGFNPAPPVGADLAAAFRQLIDQAFSASYPAHPAFEPADREVTLNELALTYAHVERAAADADGRVPLEGNASSVRRVATPLQVGSAGETHFLFGQDRFNPWGAEFERCASRDGLQPQDPVTVAQVRGWIEAMQPPFGLRDEVSDLIVLAWAALRQRAWYHNGFAIAPPKPGSVRPEMQLRQQPLPDAADWQRAIARAATLFGIAANRFLTGPAVADLATKVQEAAAGRSEAVHALTPRLVESYTRSGLDSNAPTGRLATARAVADLIDRLRRATDRLAVVEILSRAELPASEEVTARSISSATAVAAVISAYRSDRLEPLMMATEDDDRGRRAKVIVKQLREGIRSEELVVALSGVLTAAEDAAFRWLGDFPPPPPPTPPPPGAAPRITGSVVRETGAPADPVLDVVRTFLDEHADDRVVVEWHVEE
jgi:hypothetical protein